MFTTRPAMQWATLLSVAIGAASGLSPPAGAGTERIPKNERPTWWDGPDFKNNNPDLNDGDNDGKPDGWSTSGHAENTPPGSGETTITQSGSISQDIPNAANTDYAKEYALEITYRTDGLEESDQLTVSVDPEGGAAHTYTMAHTGGEEVTGTVYYRMSPQPASETITIQLAGNSSNDQVTIKKFDFRTKCVLKKDSTFRCASHGLGTGDEQDTAVLYDPERGTLALSEPLIRVLNADGSNWDDPRYGGDPLHNAVLSFSELTLHEMTPDGIWFRDGLMAIHDYQSIYFEAEIPWLWIDEQAKETHGVDMFADLDETVFDLDLGSDWLRDFVAAYQHQFAWPALFFRTGINLEEAIREAVSPVQALASANFGSGGDCTPGCTGQERIKRAKCKSKLGDRRLTVKLAGGVPFDSFRVELTSGEMGEGALNRKGDGSARFGHLPPGPGMATATFGCGAVEERGYLCP